MLIAALVAAELATAAQGLAQVAEPAVASGPAEPVAQESKPAASELPAIGTRIVAAGVYGPVLEDGAGWPEQGRENPAGDPVQAMAEPVDTALGPAAIAPAVAQQTQQTRQMQQAAMAPAPGAAPAEDGSADPAMAEQASADPVDLVPGQAQATQWTLEQLIGRAVRDNPRVLAQQAGLAVARAGEAAARWEYFPNPQVQVEGTPHDHQINTTITQPLYAFGRLGAGLSSARAQGRVAGGRADEARRDIALRVLELYGQFATQRRQIAVLDGDIARHLALEATIHRRVEAGVSAPVDLNLVQTRLTQSRIARIALQARLRATLVALSEVIGVPLAPTSIHLPGDGVAPAAAAPGPGLATSIDGRSFLVDEPGGGDLIQRCLDRNPSLRRADAEVEAAQAEARRARAVVFPTIAARFENRTRTSLYPGTGLPDTRLTIGFTIATGAGLASLANMRAADGRTRLALQSRAALRQDVTTTLVAALETFTAARRSVAGLRESRNVQEQTAESYSRMFLAGKRSWLDLLNMVREQTGIERDLADAEIQLMIADYRLRIEAGDFA